MMTKFWDEASNSFLEADDGDIQMEDVSFTTEQDQRGAIIVGRMPSPFGDGIWILGARPEGPDDASVKERIFMGFRVAAAARNYERAAS